MGEDERAQILEAFLDALVARHGEARRPVFRRELEAFLHHAPALPLSELGLSELDAHLKALEWHGVPEARRTVARVVGEALLDHLARHVARDDVEDELFRLKRNLKR